MSKNKVKENKKEKQFPNIILEFELDARWQRADEWMFGTNLICYQRPKAGYET